MYREGLLEQEFYYGQFTPPPEPPPAQTVVEQGGALTGLSSNTLTVGPKSGTVQNIEAPQPLGTNANPTFNSINTVDDATSRSNLGLGGLSTQSPGAAVANLGGSVSNPPTQAEVQAIQDKLNALLTSLRNAGIIAT